MSPTATPCRALMSPTATPCLLSPQAAAGSPASPRKGKLEAAQAADAAING